MKKNYLLLLIVAIAAVMMTSCDESWVNPPTQNGEYTKTPDSFVGQEATVRPKDSIVVVTKDSTITKFINDTIYIPGKTDSIYIVTTEHDTILVPVEHTDTVYIEWVNKFNYSFEKTETQDSTYWDGEAETKLTVEKQSSTENYEAALKAAAAVEGVSADTLFLTNLGENISYLPPVTTYDETFDRQDDKVVISKTDRRVNLKMSDTYEADVKLSYEQAFAYVDGVAHQLQSYRIGRVEYLGHKDKIIKGDTIIRKGKRYNAIHRVAPIGVDVMVFPQVGDPYQKTVVLYSDNTMEGMEKKIYVEDTTYTPPTPPTPPSPGEPDDPNEPDEPGYAHFIHIYKSVAVNMAGGLEHAFVGLKDDSTLVAFSLNECQYADGIYTITDPSEFTVSDNPVAYNSVSYDGNLIPAVLKDEQGSKRWYYEGRLVCAFKDGSLSSKQRDQHFDINSIEMQDLSYKVRFENVGNTTRILMTNYTVVLKHSTTSSAANARRAPKHVSYRGIRANVVY